MKPSQHLRWSAERLLALARQDRRALAAQRREAVTALVGLPLVFGLAVSPLHTDDGAGVSSLEALAFVALLTSLVLWFRLLRDEPRALPEIDPYAGAAPETDPAGVRQRLQQSREDLVRCCRELRAAVLRGHHGRRTAWQLSFAALVLMLLVLALRGLA